jgi:hypothetical protein
MEKVEINPRYKVWVLKEYEIPMLAFVKEHKFNGFMYPNIIHGAAFDLFLPPDMAMIMKLTFPCRIELCAED